MIDITFTVTDDGLPPETEYWLGEIAGGRLIKTILSSMETPSGQPLEISTPQEGYFPLTTEGLSPVGVLCRALLKASTMLQFLGTPEGITPMDVQCSPEGRIYLDFEEINVCRVTVSFTLSCQRG